MDRSKGRLPVLAKALLWPVLDDEDYDEALGEIKEIRTMRMGRAPASRRPWRSNRP